MTGGHFKFQFSNYSISRSEIVLISHTIIKAGHLVFVKLYPILRPCSLKGCFISKVGCAWVVFNVSF